MATFLTGSNRGEYCRSGSSGLVKERLPNPPEENYTTVSPDGVCETLSHRTDRIDRIRKMSLSAQYGVSYAWLIDPAGSIAQAVKVIVIADITMAVDNMLAVAGAWGDENCHTF